MTARRRLDPYALDRNPTGQGEWLNPPLLSRDESTFMLHACGFIDAGANINQARTDDGAIADVELPIT